MNNSVFGKTMENLRNRVDVNLVRCIDEENSLASPRFAGFKIFDRNLAAIHMHKPTLKLNRPVYVGISILDLSQHFMYVLYYNHLKAKYSDVCNLLYTDTDSLILDIKTEDVYADMASDKDSYDFIIRAITRSILTRIKKL